MEFTFSVCSRQVLVRVFLLAMAVASLCGTARAQGKAATVAADAATTLTSAERLYRDRVALFVEENKTLAADLENIVFLGDSITQGFRLADYFPGLPVLNRGIGSDIAEDYFPKTLKRGILNRMDSSLYDCRPKAVLLLIGTNSMGNGQPMEKLIASVKKIVDDARARFPKVQIVITTIPPSGDAYAKWGKPGPFNERAIVYNDLLRAYAKEQGFPVIDLWALLKDEQGKLPEKFTGDGIHLEKEAYVIWADRAREILKELGMAEAKP